MFGTPNTKASCHHLLIHKYRFGLSQQVEFPVLPTEVQFQDATCNVLGTKCGIIFHRDALQIQETLLGSHNSLAKRKELVFTSENLSPF